MAYLIRIKSILFEPPAISLGRGFLFECSLAGVGSGCFPADRHLV